MNNYPDHTLLVLDKYREWLNLWFADDRRRATEADKPTIPDLVMDDFFKYPGETVLLGDVDIPDLTNKKSVVWQAGYGDDGGPAILFGVLEDVSEYGSDHPEWEVVHILQEFDTGYSTIWTREASSGELIFQSKP